MARGTHPKVKEDQKDDSKTYKTHTKMEQTAMTAGQEARE
jgi:hypothetical protein